MDYQAEYQKKLTTAAEAVKVVKSGDWVDYAWCVNHPVALDQASVDLVYEAEDGASLVERMESRNAYHVLEHGEDIGLGSRTYRLVSIDA